MYNPTGETQEQYEEKTQKNHDNTYLRPEQLKPVSKLEGFKNTLADIGTSIASTITPNEAAASDYNGKSSSE